ncbi:Conserved_hypothetical protein [Hexamita inflata]|uniref:HNH nuclease domain-containing protein n=1 Tax=Hexamita inflata TaxID=28002 RepID=A0AA86PQR1_9EUKA|nr:Conserved hypothetical protein [Hexamita inflata]CAI9944610.1 Conserved hypothetical protein [Hexamita inflata]CAI9978043.1 Conserved hypothetical protein [Hexamita inflata]
MSEYQILPIPGFERYTINEDGEVFDTKDNKQIIQTLDKDGYYRIKLVDQNNKRFNKYVHRLLAETFIPNPLNLPEVDHILAIKTDNRLTNLRWVSRSDNQKNKNGYNDLFEFVDTLPEDADEVEFYTGHQLQNYYYSPSLNKMYFNNGVRIRIMIPRYCRKSLIYLCLDRFNKHIQIYLTRLQKGLYNNE